ncbi:hypothetical protein CQ14_21840 [Bradyrhizobium lablabi]|uniref:DUF1835 domain-containing protein n=1 Tax=Bradyrhizobium lablabi TaxID=722472 RepID=A0A0R3MNE7_9BRAD|nr:hypothetical protein [Bradyrhizobium lablabi]KRR21118.1 hypothetical protein CQ14_21840 [Bradyrhizobium lablabi]
MTHLVLTADSSSAGGVVSAGHADLAVAIELRMVWGPPRSDAELAAFWAARTSQEPGSHWLDSVPPWRLQKFGMSDLGLIDACRRAETVEFWMDTEPNAQLVLIWLLDHLGPQAKSLGITLRHVDASLGETEPARLAEMKFPGVAIDDRHIEVAGLAWQSIRAPTPHDWFNLLSRDLSILPQLRRCVLEMLEELPARATGLGASELRILELIAAGYVYPFDVFPHYRQRFQRRVFGYWEAGALLEGLALAPVPAVSGLAEWPFTLVHNERERLARYKASRLSLTALGKAILAGTEDFSRHNPIDRWWGGTHLTNDRLWRWDPVLLVP